MPDRPRIAFLSEHASPVALLGGQDAGGQNVYVDEISHGLGRLGFLVDVFTRRDDPDAPHVRDWAPGVRVIAVPAGPVAYLPKDDLWPLMPAFQEGIERFAASDGVRYDLIHGNFWMSGWVAMRLGRRWGVPVVQIFHAMGKTKRRYQGAADTSPDDRIATELAIVREADRLIAQCPSEEAELVTDYGADPARVRVIPSAVDTETFRPVARDEARRAIGLNDDDPVVVYVGRMLPRKGIRNVVRAVAHLAADHDLHPCLLLVGGETAEPDPVATPEIGALQALAAELGIADRVIFTGKRQPELLRYYYAAKLNGSMEDIDLNLEDFAARVNSDLVGKYVNIASRCAGFITKKFGGKLGAVDRAATAEFEASFAQGEIAESYESRDFGRSLREIMRLADAANLYIAEMKPWEMAKQEGREAELHRVCSTAMSLFRDLTLYLKPVLPKLAEAVEAFLNIPPLAWTDAWAPLPEGHEIREYQHLMARIDPKKIEAMVEENRQNLAPTPEPAPVQHAQHQQAEARAETAASAWEPFIGIDEFSKVDLRIARIANAEHVESAEKLLKLTLDIGTETRTVFAGIKSAYAPESLVGRLTVMVANLAPRKMKFGLSEGMVLAASDERGGPFLLSPDSGAQPGMRIK